jgi:hypothetical protein
MTELLRSRTTLIWFLLVAATIFSWEMGHGVGLHDARYAGAAIIVVAFVKVRFVILDFMEIRHAPLPMRIVGEAWVLIVCTILIALFLKSPQ